MQLVCHTRGAAGALESLESVAKRIACATPHGARLTSHAALPGFAGRAIVSSMLILVTGANRGIGRAITEQLLAKGHHVVAAAREEDAAAEVAEDHVALDVTDAAHIERVARRFEAEGLDGLVNNAGIALHGFDAGVVRRTLAVNFYGAMNLTDALLPHLRPHAKVVMMSSGMGEVSCLSTELAEAFLDDELSRAGLVELVERFHRDVERGRHRAEGWPSSAYSVSKVALNALTRVLDRELAGDPRGILVNAACPGWVRTDMGGSSAPRSPAEGARTPVWLATLPDDGPHGGFFRDERPAPW